jgi:hypothetical protein
MERGSLRIANVPIMPEMIAFVVPGTPTSMNPLKAFHQGLKDELSDRVYDLSEMAGCRCEKCGYLEFYADPPEAHPLDD